MRALSGKGSTDGESPLLQEEDEAQDAAEAQEERGVLRHEDDEALRESGMATEEVEERGHEVVTEEEDGMTDTSGNVIAIDIDGVLGGNEPESFPAGGNGDQSRNEFVPLWVLQQPLPSERQIRFGNRLIGSVLRPQRLRMQT